MHPQPFEQTLVLTNGATVKVRTTVPKRTLLLEMDSFKHELGNPNLIPEKGSELSATELQAKNAVKSRFITRVKASS